MLYPDEDMPITTLTFTFGPEMSPDGDAGLYSSEAASWPARGTNLNNKILRCTGISSDIYSLIEYIHFLGDEHMNQTS